MSQTELERVFGEVPDDVREAYVRDCRERGVRLTPVGLINFAHAGKPLPPERRADLQRYMNQIARRLLVERRDRDATGPAHPRRRARNQGSRDRALDDAAPLGEREVGVGGVDVERPAG
jgi:hypothetical protein